MIDLYQYKLLVATDSERRLHILQQSAPSRYKRISLTSKPTEGYFWYFSNYLRIKTDNS